MEGGGNDRKDAERESEGEKETKKNYIVWVGV